MNVLIISIFYYFCGNQISYIFCCLLLNLILFFNSYDFIILVLGLSLTINLYLLSCRSTSLELVVLLFIQNQPITIGLRLWCLKPLSNNISIISWGSVLLVTENGGSGKNHRTVESHWQALSHNVVHLSLLEIRTHNVSGDRHWLHCCKSNYHTIAATTTSMY